MLREISIKPVLNGWIVKVGCQTVVFGDLNKMLTEVGKYLDDPNETEKKYREHAVNAKYTFSYGGEIEPNRDIGLTGDLAPTGTDQQFRP